MGAERASPEPPENLEAWRTDTYPAWVERYGQPSEAAKQIRDNPSKPLRALLPYVGDVDGKRIVNLMGSNGVKAVALAVLGADVTVIDISASSARFASEVALEAGVEINYVVSDVLSIADEAPDLGEFDVALAELGIVHYFTELAPFMNVIVRLLKNGGTFVLRDFHPVSTKLLTYRGSTAKVRKYKVDGDYFSEELEETPVSFAKHISGSTDLPHVLLRKWTIGEIVTAVASSGLCVTRLVEESNPTVFDAGIPKTFTLTADLILHPNEQSMRKASSNRSPIP